MKWTVVVSMAYFETIVARPDGISIHFFFNLQTKWRGRLKMINFPHTLRIIRYVDGAL